MKEKVSFIVSGKIKFEKDNKSVQDVRGEEWELEENYLYEPHITICETSLDKIFTLHHSR